MPSDLPRNILKITAALLKHQATLWLGEEAVGIAGEKLIEIGGEKLQENLDQFIATESGSEKLLKAVEDADQYFQRECRKADLGTLCGAFSLSFGNLPSVQLALKELPRAMDSGELKETIEKSLKRDLGKQLSAEQIKIGVNLYTDSLLRAIKNLKEFILPVISQTVFENQSLLLRVIQNQEKMMALLKHFESFRVSKPIVQKETKLGQLPGLQITPDLIVPYKETSNEVVVGKTISINHIRDQRFMLRTKVLADALATLDSFQQNRLNNFDPKILIFWISGRSGSGKSVLLLQIMQKMVLKKDAQAIWLDDAAESLPFLLERWAEQQEDFYEPLFVFVDDFNSPQTRDKINFKVIARLLRSPKFNKVKWPIVVTCSPPEYLEEFRKTGNTEYFEIKKWHIPPVSKVERSSFLEWFSSKTGEVAISGIAFEQDKGLILSMMFELRYGNMAEFARRFKERLEGSNLLEQMIQPLALNRLYIWAPANWLDELSPAQHDALSILNLDQDFSILNIENSSRKYIRLTHPHISNAIYKSIRPDRFGHQRADDLAGAFEKVITIDDVLASRILLVIAHGGERISNDLNERVLAEKIAVHCKKLLKNVHKSHPVNLTFIWTNLAKWATREPYINDLFSTPPLDNAINALGTDHYLWGDLWLQLWGGYPKNKKLVETAWDWVKNHFHFDEAAWYPIWNTILTNSENLPDGVTRTDLLRTGIIWLNGRENRRWWSRIWENILENSNEIPSDTPINQVVQIGANWLQGREDSGQWSFVWQGILKHSQASELGDALTEALEYGIAWLDGRQNQAQWAFVWQDILKYTKYDSPSKDITNLLEIGINSLSKRETLNQMNFIWHTLITNFGRIQSSFLRAKLIKWGLSWIDTNKAKQEWPTIYTDLAKIKYSREFKKIASPKKFLLAGVEWIEIHKNESKAAQLALFMMKSYEINFSRPELPQPDMQVYNRLLELVELMVYKSKINVQGWPFWWLAYWATSPTMKNLNIALKWMEAYSGNLEGARSIINKLLSTKRIEIIEVLESWQQNNLPNPISKIIKTKIEKARERELNQQDM